MSDIIEIKEIEVEAEEVIEIDVEEGAAWVGGDVTKHYSLDDRDATNQHTIGAITNLEAELDALKSLNTVYSDKKQQANYYMWHDENRSAENRNELFVSFYSDTGNITICNGNMDVFGVTVAEAGFIGGQECVETEKEYADTFTSATLKHRIECGREYALVVTSGLAAVRREPSVQVGDYVVPNEYGAAKKSDGNYGYLVTALSEVNKELYAIVSLTPSSILAKTLADTTQDLSKRMESAEYNIVSVANVANSAYAMAHDAQDKIDADIEYIGGQVSDALNRVDDVENTVGSMQEVVNSAYATATLAQAIANGAVSSAEAIRSEAVDAANQALAEAANTRQEVAVTVNQMQTDINNAELEFRLTKEDIISTCDQLQSNINATVKEFESLQDDLKPLATWPKGASGDDIKGIAGFVAKADENGAVLADIVNFKGEFRDSLAGFVSSATEENATVYALANYKYTDDQDKEHSSVAALNALAQDHKASIDLIAGVDESLAGLRVQVNETEASVTTLASHIVGDYVVWETWDEDKATAGTIYYAEDTKQYHYYANGWQETYKPYEAGLDGAIAGVQSTADANKAQLDTMATYDTDGKSALAGMMAYVDANSANFSELAKYSNKDSGNSGIAGLVVDVDNNTSSLSVLAEHSGIGADGNTYTGLAGLKAQVNSNSSQVDIVSSRVAGKYTVWEEEWNESGKDETMVYYVKATTEDEKNLWYYYKDGKWKSSEDPYDAGLPKAMAGIQAKTDDNSASIKNLTSWQGTTGTFMASLKQQADENGAKIEALVSNIDKYAVGEYSQAYGLTLKQAREILDANIVYVPTADCAEIYSGYTETVTNEDGSVNEINHDKYTQEFAKGYYYTWNKDEGMWVASDSNAVFFSAVYINGSEATPYWVVIEGDVEYEDITYDLGGLYLWKDDAWVKVASIIDNTLSRVVSNIKQTADSISIEVTNARGSYAGLSERLTNTESLVQSSALWAKGSFNSGGNALSFNVTAPGIYTTFNSALANYEGEGEHASTDLSYTPSQIMVEGINITPNQWTCVAKNELTTPIWEVTRYLEVNWDGEMTVEARQRYSGRIKQHGSVFVIDITLTGEADGVTNAYNLATIKQEANADGSSLSLVVADAEGNRILKGASIVLGQSEDDSYINIDADRIVMTGTTTFLSASDVGSGGETVIDGSRIQTGTISAGNGNMEIDLGNGTITSPKFNLDENGNVSINSGTLKAGVLESLYYAKSDDDTLFSEQGMRIDLNQGSITTPNFAIKDGEVALSQQCITMITSDVQDDLAVIQQKANANEVSINSLTQWKGSVVTNLASIQQKADDAGASIAQIATQVIGKYEVLEDGTWDSTNKDPEMVYYCLQDKKYHYWKQVTETTGYWASTTNPIDAGLQITAASITTAITEDESCIQMIADKIDIEAPEIDLKGYVTFSALAGTDGTTIINGGNITTGTISSVTGAMTISLDDEMITSEKFTLYGGILGQSNSICLSTTDMEGVTGFFQGTETNDWRLTVGSHFGITSKGDLYAQNANLSGHIIATTGYIGYQDDNNMGWEIQSNQISGGGVCLYTGDEYTEDDRQVRISVGEYQNLMSNPFRVFNDGYLIASNGRIGSCEFFPSSTPKTGIDLGSLTGHVVRYEAAGLDLKYYFEYPFRYSPNDSYATKTVYAYSWTGDFGDNANSYVWSWAWTATPSEPPSSWTINDYNSNIGGSMTKETPYLWVKCIVSEVTVGSYGDPEYKDLSTVIFYIGDFSGFLTIFSIGDGGLKIGENVITGKISGIKFEDTLGRLSGTWFYGDAGIATTSWRGAKTNIEEIDNRYSKLLDELRPVRFMYNNGQSNRYHTGFILDELKAAMDAANIDTSELAAYCISNETTGEGGIRYSELIALCVNEIQKLKKRVAELEDKTE